MGVGMTGFKRQAPTLALTFEGELSGLEIETKVPSSDLLEKVRLISEPIDAAVAKAFEPGYSPDPSVMGKLAEWVRLMAPELKGWNLEDENGPVPCTAEAFREQDIGLQLTVCSGWLAAITTYADTLAVSSTPETADMAGAFDESTLPVSPIE